MRIRPVLVFLAAASVLAGALPAGAYPIGPPSVFLSVEPTADPLTFSIAADAQDPDGRISSLEVCVYETSSPDCRTGGEPDQGFVRRVRACLSGGSATVAFDKAFSSYGIFNVIARATGDGCPGVGSTDEAFAQQAIAVAPPPMPIECADDDEPADMGDGVSAHEIHLATTLAQSGPISVLTGPAWTGIQAAIGRVNASGGVCDRTLEVTAVDDGFDRERGHAYINNFLAEDVFGLVAMPSWPGLSAAIVAGDVQDAGAPIVGTTGQSADEFGSDWVWPLLPSNATYGRAAVDRAFADGARKFAVVYESWLGFGSEQFQAASSRISALGAELQYASAVLPGAANTADSVAGYRNACPDGCDALLLFTDPTGTLQWVTILNQQGGRLPPVTILSVHNFATQLARSCGALCDGVVVLTGLAAPLAGTSSADIARYAADVRSVNPAVDLTNPLMESAYFGTLLLAEAMGRTGTALTREGLRAVLDAQSFETPVTNGPLSWVAGKEANSSIIGYQIASAGDAVWWAPAGGWQ